MSSTLPFVDFQPPAVPAAWLLDVQRDLWGPTAPPGSPHPTGIVGRVIDSIATLRTMLVTGPSRVFVTGYYAPGDGGGGAYYYDPADVVSADNGGTIIVAVDGGRWKFNLEAVVSVRTFGARGAGTDDTAAIQAAAVWAAQTRTTLYFPAANAGQSYNVTAPIVITSAVSIRGDNAFGTLIFAVGMAAGQRILDYNCLAASVVEQVSISGLTLRSDNGSPNGVRLSNVSIVMMKDVRFYNLANGVEIAGTRCYSHSYESIDAIATISGSTVVWAAGFTGGGQFAFNSCTFLGNNGVSVPSTAVLDNLSFVGCNFEQCVNNSLRIAGTVAGVSIAGCRTEGCDGIDFVFRPLLAAEYVGGLSITGTTFSASDNGAATRVQLGGDAGRVRGFSILGNVVTHGTDLFAGPMVTLNGDGESGLIAGNYLRGTDASGATITNGQRNGVTIFDNENLTGKLANWRGLNREGQGSFTATATGMTTSPTGTVVYSINGGAVTLSLPDITGTSNATTFTLTGFPAILTPSVTRDMLCRIQDNGGAITVGMFRFTSGGAVQIWANPAGGPFAAANAKSLGSMSVTYML